MEKLNISKLVCSAEQTEALLRSGIALRCGLCYSKEEDGYLFAGEYIGEPDCIPAWTYEELCVMIGGELAKPDMLGIKDFTPLGNLLQFRFYLLEKCFDYTSGAKAAAHMLIYMLENKIVTAGEVNERYLKFYSQNEDTQK